MLSLQDIFDSFRKLEIAEEKCDYIIWLQSKNYPYDINYVNLVTYWASQIEA